MKKGILEKVQSPSPNRRWNINRVPYRTDIDKTLGVEPATLDW